MSDIKLESIYPDEVAEYRKRLIEAIDADYDRCINDLKLRYGKIIPPDSEVKLAQVRHLEATRAYYDELTRIENTLTRYHVVAE